MSSLVAACIQMRSGVDVMANVAAASALVREAAADCFGRLHNGRSLRNRERIIIYSQIDVFHVVPSLSAVKSWSRRQTYIR